MVRLRGMRTVRVGMAVTSPPWRGVATPPRRSRVFHAQATAGVLVFRALTYGTQIPIGGITYIIWKTNNRPRHSVPVPVALPTPLASTSVLPFREIDPSRDREP
jgi:hypothetical protein